MVAERMGFPSSYPVTGQTYSRKVDAQVIGDPLGIGQSAHKAESDLRILQSRKEIEEPVRIRPDRLLGDGLQAEPDAGRTDVRLARFAMSLTANAEQTLATQWLERTLDDSANRRLAIAQSFLATTRPHHLPERHRRPRRLSQGHREASQRRASVHGDRGDHDGGRAAGGPAGPPRADPRPQPRRGAPGEVKEFGRANDLIERLKADPAFAKASIWRACSTASGSSAALRAGRRLHRGGRRPDPREVPEAARRARRSVKGLIRPAYAGPSTVFLESTTAAMGLRGALRALRALNDRAYGEAYRVDRKRPRLRP